MRLKFLLVLGYILFITSKASCNVAANHIEGQLISDMLANYTKEARPVTNPHRVVNISMIFSLSKIENLDEKNQVFVTFGWITIMWFDEFLRWDPSDYANTSRMVLRAENIWLPEIAVQNGVDSGTDLSYKTGFRASVLHFGWVLWIPTFKWKTACEVNLRYFPFDKHECEVIFVNWMYTASLVDFLVADELKLYSDRNQGEWKITGMSTFKEYVMDGGSQIPFAGFRIKVKRLPTYFLCNVIVPCVLMTVMSLMSYLLPCESGEKISLSITVLLSYSVILLIVSDLTPRTASNIPLITIYIISSMSLTGVSLLANIYVLNLHHHSGRTAPPHWMKTILLKVIARIVCVSTTRTKPSSKGKVSPAGWFNVFSSRLKLFAKKRHNSNGEMTQSDIHIEEREKQKMNTVVPGNEIQLPEEAMILIKKYLDKENEMCKQEWNRYEWQLMSKVLDRLFFYICLIYAACDTMVYFINCTN